MIILLSIAFVASQAKIWLLVSSSKAKAVMIFEMKIEDLLEDIIRDTCVDRALLCRIHNGGGRIVIGAEKKISVICEPDASLHPHTKKVYTNYPIDKQYRSVLVDMLDAGGMMAYHQIERLPYGMLRRKTEADGLTATLHYKVKETKTGVYFVFLATKDDPNELIGRPDRVNYIEEKVQQIRATCHRAALKRILK